MHFVLSGLCRTDVHWQGELPSMTDSKSQV